MIDSYNFMVNSPPCQNLKEGNGSFLPGLPCTTIPILRSTEAIGNLIRTPAVDRLLIHTLISPFISTKAPSRMEWLKHLCTSSQAPHGMENKRITNELADDFLDERSRIDSVIYVSPAHLVTLRLHLISGST